MKEIRIKSFKEYLRIWWNQYMVRKSVSWYYDTLEKEYVIVVKGE